MDWGARKMLKGLVARSSLWFKRSGGMRMLEFVNPIRNGSSSSFGRGNLRDGVASEEEFNTVTVATRYSSKDVDSVVPIVFWSWAYASFMLAVVGPLFCCCFFFYMLVTFVLRGANLAPLDLA